VSVTAAKKYFQKVENGGYNHLQRNLAGGELD